jgi:hypothetical protein
MADDGQSSGTSTNAGGAAPGGGTAQPGQQGGSQGGQRPGADSDRGYPADTPVAEMSVDQQAAYWKHQARKHESTVKARADYDDLKSKATQYDDLVRTTQSEQERAIADARKQAAEEATAAARKTYGGQLVEAHLTAALAGRLDKDAREALLEGVDRNRFLAEDGSVATDKVTAWADRVAPRRQADLGQGQRGPSSSPTSMNDLIRRAAGRG